MLLAIGFCYLVGVARLRIWRVARGSRRMTLGTLAITTATVLFLRSVERIIDPRMLFGANLGHLAQHLLTICACYEFGALALETAKRSLTWWRISMGAVGVALLVTYRTGHQYSVPADEFTLGDTPSRIHQWLLLLSMMAAFLLVLLSSIPDVTIAGFGARVSMIFTVCVGVIGVGCNLLVGVLMVADPPVVASDYHRIAFLCTIPGLYCLGIAGLHGLVSAWTKRDDPRL